MSEEIDLNSYLTSPFSKDIQQQQKAFLSAQNIRKATETVEEYKARMAKYKEEHEQKLIQENTDVLQRRLANLDIANISNQNRSAIENLIKEAQSIKFFAYNNRYNTGAIDFSNLDKAIIIAQARLKSINEGNEKPLRTGIFADNYQFSTSENKLPKIETNTKNKFFR